MDRSTAQRRLVRSPPELWAEVSSEDALGRRLAQFGEIRITRVEPETAVAWEGERASGTVELAPTGWGTRVTLTAVPTGRPTAAAPTPEAIPAPESAAIAAEQQPEPRRGAVPPPPRSAEGPVAAPPARKLGFFARLFRRRRNAPKPAAAQAPRATSAVVETLVEAPAPTPPPAAPEPSPPALGPEPPPPDRGPAPTLPKPAVAPADLDTKRTVAILTEVLDDLGSDHHRPLWRDALT